MGGCHAATGLQALDVPFPSLPFCRLTARRPRTGLDAGEAPQRVLGFPNVGHPGMVACLGQLAAVERGGALAGLVSFACASRAEEIWGGERARLRDEAERGRMWRRAQSSSSWRQGVAP